MIAPSKLTFPWTQGTCQLSSEPARERATDAEEMRSMMMRKLAVLVLLVGACAVLLSGCGEKKSQPAAESKATGTTK